MLQAAGQEGGVALHRPDLHRTARLGEALRRGRSRRRMADQLGDHRIIVGRHLAPLLHCRVHPHGVGRKPEVGQRASRGQEAGRGVLGVEARLDGVPVQPDLVLRQGQGLSRSNAKLPLHQIQAGDGFGDRVLDLQPGVHLHEPDPVGP